MKIYAACDAYRLGIRISERIASVECQRENWRKEELWSVYIAAAEVAPVEDHRELDTLA